MVPDQPKEKKTTTYKRKTIDPSNSLFSASYHKLKNIFSKQKYQNSNEWR